MSCMPQFYLNLPYFGLRNDCALASPPIITSVVHLMSVLVPHIKLHIVIISLVKQTHLQMINFHYQYLFFVYSLAKISSAVAPRPNFFLSAPVL